MRAHRDAVLLLAGSAVQDLAFRLAQVALPLVVLQQTGSVALTGLVAGATGLPVVASPLWARTARQRFGSGRSLALLAGLDAVALSIVPLAVLGGVLGAPVLVLAGLLLGTGEALGAPGRAALLSDVGDRTGPDRAVTLLTVQDLLRRTGTVVGPGIGAIGVAAGWTVAILWIQAAAVLVSGLLAWTVPGSAPAPGDDPGAAPSIRQALAGRREVLVGWVLRGVSNLTWFAFALGLAVLGVQQGSPGWLYAAGTTGYGVGAVIGTLAALRVVSRVPVGRVAVVAWTVGGLCWVLLGLWPTYVGAAVAGAVCAGFVVVGIAAVNATITRTSTGAVRRTLMGGQAVVVTASSSAGMLLGGSVIALLGVRPTLVVTGLLGVVVSLAAPRLLGRRRETGDSTATVTSLA